MDNAKPQRAKICEALVIFEFLSNRLNSLVNYHFSKYIVVSTINNILGLSFFTKEEIYGFF